jgi:protein KRI1
MSSNNNKDALFDDDSPEVEAERGGGFQVNKRFAKDYQSRKQQEELRNHIPGNSDDDSSSDDESEDEDGELLTPGIDVSILKTINALRNKDESIYNPDSKFFDDSTADVSSSSKEKSGHVKKHFKDVLREQILDQIEEEEGRKLTNNSNLDEPKDRLEYDAEQKDLRSAFLENDDDDADEDDILVVKTKAQPVSNDELEKEYETMRKSNIKGSLKDPHGEVEDGDRFLLDFLKNKKWVDKDDDDDAMNDNDDDNEPQQRDNDDDSIDDVHRADDFESKYNFRFEEAQSQIKSGADYSVMAYARSGTMDTLRRKDDTRRTKRLDRQERKAAERKIKEEQLRRLKNAKREEMEMKLKEIKKVMGAVQDVDEDAMMKLMEGDYDPEKFEKLMQDQYGDDFYEEEEKQWKSDGDVRDSLLQDEDGNQLVGEDDADGGLYDNQEDEQEEAAEEGEEEYYSEDEETGGDDPDELPPAESKLEQRLQTKLQEELYKLDYEDIVAGMPTRFKYRKVEKNSFGLSTHEILLARDSTLKNFVSLKKIAPYRDDGEHAVGHKARRRFRDMLEEDLAEMAEKEGIVTKEHNKEEQLEVEDGGKKKRRRQKKGKKEKSEEAVLEEEVPAADDVADVEKETEADDNDEGGKKKRRKKNGKKKEKSEDTEMPPADDAEKETDDNDDEGAKKKKRKKKGKKGQNNNAEEETPDEKAVESSTKEKSSEEKTKKKNKKMLQKLKKKKLIEGVSASRLEAYGL